MVAAASLAVNFLKLLERSLAALPSLSVLVRPWGVAEIHQGLRGPPGTPHP